MPSSVFHYLTQDAFLCSWLMYVPLHCFLLGRLTFVIVRDRFAIGEHTVRITVRDLHGVSESLIIPFQRLPPPLSNPLKS